MNNTTTRPAVTAARLIAVARAVRRSPGGAPVFLTTSADDHTGQWALPTTYTRTAATGLTCLICDHPTGDRPTVTTLHAVGVGPIWAHRDCHDQAIAEIHAAAARFHTTHTATAAVTA